MIPDISLLVPLLVGLYPLTAVVAAGHALLHKRDPRSAWGWVAVCWLFPLAGALLYYLLGVNRIHIRARKLVGTPARVGLATGALPSELPQMSRAEATQLRELVRIGEAMSGLPLAAGNSIEPLIDGEQAYPAMLKAITHARHTVHLASYIYMNDKTGVAFAEALAAAQKRGVKVRLLLDGVADFYYRPRASRMLAKHELRCALFLPLRWYPPMLHVNLRNHRKLLTVDGEVAFTGGINIADYHMAQRHKGSRVQDLHFSITGPLVHQIEAVFATDWRYATGEDIAVPDVESPSTGGAMGRVITDGPNEDLDKLLMVLLEALASAHRRVWIMTPYFLPDPSLIVALQAVALRGVEVCILLPERSDQPWVDWATRNLLWQLLQQQVRVYYRPSSFAHSKLFLVDDHYVQIGSANLDDRSLRLNFEMMVEAYDSALVSRLAGHFETVRGQSREVTLKEAIERPLLIRLRDAFFWLFSPYL